MQHSMPKAAGHALASTCSAFLTTSNGDQQACCTVTWHGQRSRTLALASQSPWQSLAADPELQSFLQLVMVALLLLCLAAAPDTAAAVSTPRAHWLFELLAVSPVWLSGAPVST